jgi:hypothetical protein
MVNEAEISRSVHLRAKLDFRQIIAIFGGAPRLPASHLSIQRNIR